MASITRSSFQKKGATNSNLLEGTRPSLHNSQLLISSGIPVFDNLIGGGIPLGAIVLIDEDQYGTYAKFFLKYFLAEGLLSHHGVYLCSEDTNTEEMIKELPNPVNMEFKEEDEVQTTDSKMKIAWRYKHLKTVSASSSKHKHFGHYFDLSKHIDDRVIKNSDITYWSRLGETSGKCFQDTAYSYMLKSISKKLEEGNYLASQNTLKRSILRIGLHRLNSPLWQYDSISSSQNFMYLLTFLYSLRALIRNAYASCVITLPFSKFKNDLISKCIHLCDIAVELQSFAGTKCENVSPYKDYHGFFIIQKLAAINTLVAYNPQVTNLVFKLKQKKLVIEEFHLPPELEDSTQREQDDTRVLMCSSGKSSILDF